ncbi:hypothetical protein B566_EDAN012994 [Ephemera danica]|nr:hypothetical protein B566_EDAN012994 [Ephemera danica]
MLINEEDPESRNIVLPYLSVECFFEPLKMKQRCKSQTSGAQLKRLGTGIYSFQTAQKVNWYAAHRSFIWVATGQPLGSYTNWSPGQPAQPAGVEEHCGEYMYRDAPKPAWNDRGCTATGPFICEVNAPCKCYAGV